MDALQVIGYWITRYVSWQQKMERRDHYDVVSASMIYESRSDIQFAIVRRTRDVSMMRYEDAGTAARTESFDSSGGHGSEAFFLLASECHLLECGDDRIGAGAGAGLEEGVDRYADVAGGCGGEVWVACSVGHAVSVARVWVFDLES